MNKRWQSFVYAGKGIRVVFGNETNMKIHLVITLLVIIAGFVFQISAQEWALCLLCMAVVMGLEMMNTAVETVVDLVSPQKHPLAGKAKDIAAGAVLIAAILSVLIGLIVFLPKIWCLLQCQTCC